MNIDLKTLLADADEIEAGGAGNEAENMRAAAWRIEEADAEIARLRAVLEYYASGCDSRVDGSGDCGYEGNTCCKAAFEALKT